MNNTSGNNGDLIYHFTDYNTALYRILKNKELKFRYIGDNYKFERTKMLKDLHNAFIEIYDKSELRKTFFIESLKISGSRNMFKTKRNIDALFQLYLLENFTNLVKEIPASFPGTANYEFICCFANSKTPYHWGRKSLGRKHEGVCICFDKEKLLEPLDCHFLSGNVEYIGDEYIPGIREDIESLFEEINNEQKTKGLNGYNVPHVMAAFNQHFNRFRLSAAFVSPTVGALTKAMSIHLKKEDEFRIVAWLTSREATQYFNKNIVVKATQEIYVKFPPQAVKQIVIGKKADFAEAQMLIQKCGFSKNICISE
jgi:hypothetical protein